ncbi:RNA-directed DNA polymerase, eukaryota [Tanacetum coccineum]
MRFPNIGDTTRRAKYVPIKVNILAWKIRCDVLPTRMNLSRRGIDIQATSCPICDYGVESSEHLFFRCNMIRDIGKQIVRWWNINYEEVSSYEEWKTWLTSYRMAPKLKQVFEGVWLMILFGVGYLDDVLRNLVLLKNGVVGIQNIFDLLGDAVLVLIIKQEKVICVLVVSEDTCGTAANCNCFVVSLKRRLFAYLGSKVGGNIPPDDLCMETWFLKQRYPMALSQKVKKTCRLVASPKLSHENLTWSFRRAPRSGVEQDQLTDVYY